MTVCPLCGHRNAGGATTCAACGHDLPRPAVPPPRGRFFTRLSVLLMFVAPLAATPLVMAITYLASAGRLPGGAAAALERTAPVIFGIWFAVALASGAGWALAACRRWGFGFIRAGVFFGVGVFSGATIFFATWGAAARVVQPWIGR